MRTKFSAVNLKGETLDELKSLKLLLDCKTYDDVFACLIMRAGLRESLDEIRKIRSEFPMIVDNTVKHTMEELEKRAKDNGSSVLHEARMLQRDVVEKRSIG